MVAGTKRGVLFFSLHTFSVHVIVAVFVSLFVEYYIHQCLLVVKVTPAKAKGGREEVVVLLSKWRLSLLALAQLVYSFVATLHRGGLLSSLGGGQLLSLPRQLSNEQRFVLVFGLSWCALRFPLLPSALCFTVVFAAVSALAGSCVDFTARAAREMALQRPKEGEWIGLASQLANGGAAAVGFVAALLYDGTTPQSGSLRGFYWLLFGLTASAFAILSVLQYLRRHTSAENAIFLAGEEVEVPFSPRSSFVGADTSNGEFNSFVRQTCQRRSMKAFLAVRALHCYAHTLVLYFFHLMLTLGCESRLSSSSRAALLALVLAASAFLGPLCAGMSAAVGKKRGVSLSAALVAVTGALALLLACTTRETIAAAAPLAPARAATKKPKETAEVVSTARTVWCAVLIVVQRLCLDAVQEMLDLAQEDVVEEDAILFGRATSMAAATKRLASVPSALMQSLSFIVTLVYLAASGAFRVVWRAQTAKHLTTPSHTVTTALPPSSSFSWSVAANGSTVLALLGFQTCGVAVAMAVVWQRFYNLEGKHLQFVQMATRKRKEEQTVSIV